MSQSDPNPAQITRDFTVAVFVVHDGRVLLHWHKKLARWLPPGGHIEPNELPDEAAQREVMEETSVPVRLVGEPGIAVNDPSLPRQLVRPAGIQLEDISPNHQHIDLIYFAEPTATVTELPEDVGWFGPEEWVRLSLTAEVTAWGERALAEVARLQAT